MDSGSSRAYALGATLIAVGLSATVRVDAMAGQLSGFFKIASGGGTLCIVQGASSISSQGYPVAAAEVIQLEGPATFFLAAAGATMTVGFVPRYSQGYSTI